MIDERDRFERAFELFPMPEPSFDRLVRRRDRKHRNRRIGAATIALAVAAVGVTGAVKAFTRSERQQPAERRISPLPIPSPMHNGPFTLFGLVSWGITQVNQEGDPATRLVRCESHCTTIPSAAWTADGTRIAFIAECEGGCASAGDPYHGIRVLDVRTAQDTLIVAGDDFEALDWSPDGTRIVYATRPEGRVFVMNADGSGRLPLKAEGGRRAARPAELNNVISLSWSPDGTSILYVTSGQQMFLYSFVSSRSVPLGSGRNPDWSPDGTRIAYADPSGL
jgi:Tol biopolymer transport system component